MNIHLITFAAHHDNRYESRRNSYKKVAEGLGVFNTINVFSNFNCYDYCPELLNHKHYMDVPHRRGYGYWVWKFFLVREFLNNIPEGDLILYTDIGCTFNYKGKPRFMEYCDIVQEKNSLTFELEHLEFTYTKMDTYKRIFPDDDSHGNTGQRCSGIFFLKNNKENKDIFDELKQFHVENNYINVTDEPSMIPNHPSFVEHRHDQSIFSLMTKKHNMFAIQDETYWINWETDGINYPIWARRIVG